jgi:hypothetical protein
MKNIFEFYEIDQLQHTGVYSIYCKDNDTYYIGSTRYTGENISLSKKGFYGRWTNHLSHLLKDKHRNKYLQHTFNKYGLESLKFEILEFVEPNKCIEREQYWLNYYKEKHKIFNSQMECLVLGSYVRTEEHKQKLSKLFKGKKRDMSIFKTIVKPVIQYTKNMEFVAEFCSLTEAFRQTGVQRCDISHVCRGNTKTAGGYIWRFKS